MPAGGRTGRVVAPASGLTTSSERDVMAAIFSSIIRLVGNRPVRQIGPVTHAIHIMRRDHRGL